MHEVSIELLAELPPVAAGNAFPVDASSSVPTRSLKLLVDHETGLLSLGNVFSPEELRHAHEWLIYREPEAHSEALGQALVTLCDLTSESRVAGISWKDEGVLKAICESGASTTVLWPRAWERVSFPPQADWIRDSIDVQEKVSQSASLANLERFDLVVVRHILEHALSLEAFLEGITKLVKLDGYVMFEVPDCAQAIATCDWSVLWEEHVHYFTSDSLLRSLERAGWETFMISRDLSAEEPILIAVARPIADNDVADPFTRRSVRFPDLIRFTESFDSRRERLLSTFRELRDSGVDLYVLGANHTASTFLDLFAETGLFTACLDDMQEKQGSWISGCKVLVSPLSVLQGSPKSLVINAVHQGRAVALEKRIRSMDVTNVAICSVSEVVRRGV